MTLEKLSRKIRKEIPVRRYALSDMISEGYRILYDSEEGTNLQKLSESYLNDLKNHPKEIERLSKDLSILKEVSRMVESGQLKDTDLVDKKNYDTVAPKKERVIVKSEIDESNNVTDRVSKKRVLRTSECSESGTGNPRKGAKIKSQKESVFDPKNKSIYKAKINEAEDEDEIELTDEELDELAKHLETIRKNKTKGVKESKKPNESKSYGDLSNFKKQSESKAFFKTLKKMHESLKEGKALTRQESIDLYKASNSALTQLSIELEHNPEFLSTFNECTSILSEDVSDVLSALKEGKAPSKKTMKSISKFTEALLRESEESLSKAIDSDLGDSEERELIKSYFKDPDSEEEIVRNYAEEHNVDKEKARKLVRQKLGLTNAAGEATTPDSLERRAKAIKESEEEDEVETPEDNPEIDTDDDFISDDEGDIMSEEAEEFYQEYADARKEILDDLKDKYEDSEDPQVQEMIAKETEEVAEITGEDEEEPEIEDPEGEPEEEETPVESEDDITDDEIAELKKHLEEMRKSKKN